MWVVLAPPTLSLPITVGLTSQCRGSIPSLDSAPEPELPPEEEVSDEKLDSSCLKVPAGNW